MIHLRVEGIFQHMQTSKCNLSHKETEIQNSHEHLIRYKKGLCQIPTIIQGKSARETGGTRDIPQHNRGKNIGFPSHHQPK